MANPPKPKRRWYQYSLRTLFIITTLFALVCGWYAYEMQKAAKRRAAIAEFEKLGGRVWYYDVCDSSDIRGETPAWYSWLRKFHGDKHLGNAVGVDFLFVSLQDTDAALEHVKGLANLEMLWIDDTKVTDEGAKKIEEALPKCEIYHFIWDTVPLVQ